MNWISLLILVIVIWFLWSWLVSDSEPFGGIGGIDNLYLPRDEYGNNGFDNYGYGNNGFNNYGYGSNYYDPYANLNGMDFNGYRDYLAPGGVINDRGVLL
jgi:hypothetical protein